MTILAVGMVLAGCSPPERGLAVPRTDTERALPLGLADARFYPDTGARLFVEAGNAGAGRRQLPPAYYLAVSGGDDNGAFGAVRQVLRASAAIPGLFQLVLIDVELDGKKYQELHVDGGAIAQLFLYPPSIDLRGVGIVRERHAYIIRNARLDPDYAVSERRTISIAGRAIDTMLAASGRNDVLRAYFTTKRDGVDYNLGYIGADFDTPKEGEFDQRYMRALFDYGYRQATLGLEWHKAPPGLEANEAEAKR